MDHSRRQFINRLLSNTDASEKAESTSFQTELYFTSFEHCYPLLAEAQPFLDDQLKAYFDSPDTNPIEERALLQAIFAQQNGPNSNNLG